MIFSKPIILIDYSRPIKDTSRHAYRWIPTEGASDGRGFYQSSKALEMDRAGSSFALRIEEANDFLSSRARDVTGYYCDEFQDCTMTPIVARLPKGRGFLPGWTMGRGMCATIECVIYECAEDAAHDAHRLAERDAEREREYQADERERLDAEETAEAEAEHYLNTL